MTLRFALFALLASLLTGCAHHDNGCEDTQCRPVSDSHHLTIWWPADMRSGVQDYSQMPVR